MIIILYPVTGSCVLEIPGPDIKLDILAWASDTFYTATSEIAGQQGRYFQVNVCFSCFI